MKVQSFVRLVTALSFALFSAYQIYMATQIASNRTGRLIGICLYLAITAASCLAFSYSLGVQNVRSILMIISLTLLFAVRLVNFLPLFRGLRAATFLSVLDFAVYILPQIGTVILAVMWLKRRRMDVTFINIAPMIPVTIAIYALCFAAECVMMVHYRVNLDVIPKLALLSRLLYFVGFAGIAVSFLFNDPEEIPDPDRMTDGQCSRSVFFTTGLYHRLSHPQFICKK